MKFNKWTLGLAAVGVVSLTSAARADEKMSTVQTALSNTTISGYVSASANVQLTPGGNIGSPADEIPFQPANSSDYYEDYASHYGYLYNYAAGGKQDGFNLDVVKLSISKPEDESPWASGYNVDLYFGPDAVGYNSPENGYDANSSIKQAYITLRTPVGNGIDWKIGVFDTIIGYEVTDSGSNPNYTRSWGYFVEPTEHTGVLATYKVNDQWSFSAGIANTLSAGINTRATTSSYYDGDDYKTSVAAWHKTFMASATYVAPMSWGWAAGSSIYLGAVYGFGGTSTYAGGNQFNLYAGATVNTPWSKLTAGIAFDYVHNFGDGSDENYFISTNHFDNEQTWTDTAVVGLYATYKASDKLSFNGRAEWVYSTYYDNYKYNYTYDESGYLGHGNYDSHNDLVELTGTVEYDLWANVMSRVEIRWDHDMSADYSDYGGSAASVGLYANVIYKF